MSNPACTAVRLIRSATNPKLIRADLLPDRTDLPGAVGALYRKAQKVGLTRQRWHTMVQIIDGDDPARHGHEGGEGFG